MKILIVDREQGKAKNLKSLVLTAFPNADVFIECDAEEACYLVERKEFSAVLTETKRGDYDGLKFARAVHDRAPNTRVVFITENAELAVPAFKTRAVSYLLEPVSIQELTDEFIDLGVSGGSASKKVEAKTFGNFELFCNGEIVKFGRSKSKELIAYLIDKNGTTATGSELIVNLWEDKDVDRTTRSMLHNLVSDVKATLRTYGISDIFITERNAFMVKRDKIVCDYFDLLDGKKDAKRKFKGEYMSAYEWAEFTIGRLFELAD